MSKESSKAPVVEATLIEGAAQEFKLAVNQQTALVRGWKSVTPEVIEASRAADEARTNALTQQLLTRFS